jgi:hypothetical protein
MGCHNRARAVDYVFTIPLNATTTRRMELSPWRREMIDYLRSIVTSPVKR